MLPSLSTAVASTIGVSLTARLARLSAGYRRPLEHGRVLLGPASASKTYACAILPLGEALTNAKETAGAMARTCLPQVS